MSYAGRSSPITFRHEATAAELELCWRRWRMAATIGKWPSSNSLAVRLAMGRPCASPRLGWSTATIGGGCGSKPSGRRCRRTFTYLHPLGIEGAQLLALAVALCSRMDRFDRAFYFAELLAACESAEYRAKI